SRRLANELRRLGAQSGDRVVVLMPNSAAAAVAVWAVFEVGCVLVPLHAASKLDALLPALKSAEPRWVISVAELSGLLRALLAETPSVARTLIVGTGTAQMESSWIAWTMTEDAADAIGPTSTHSVLPDSDSALAALLFTSGSTGEPKGVMLTHANMQAALRAVLAYLPLRSDDVIYSPLPLSSSYGLYQLIMSVSLGATLVLDRSFSFPAQSLASIAAERVTVLAAVPTMYAWLATTPLVEKHDLSPLRILTSAAAALPIEHARRVRERLPNALLYVMYGQTECKRISYLDPAHLDSHPGSVGRGIPYQDHAIVNEFGTAVPVGEVGELVVRGPHVMQGYWRAAASTATKLRTREANGGPWLFTDDLFRCDADGFLYYVGRRDDILKIGGNKVSPSEIEEVLCQMPELAEVAVVGMPDDAWGEAVCAHVVLKDGAQCSSEDIIRFCMPRLRGFMVPKAVVITRSLPKTESGKVKRRELR
ncbi:MAG TPA: class I adenylate-forming enzyme family protein, partial [Steroidobacteraceae bacterium]|nr:class I adenylate-forming enzyme family protein [Steroidobacteraceae bacterium]